MPGSRGERISLIWQDPALALNPVISVGAQIGEVLRAHSRLNRRDRRARVEQLLAEVGFASPADVYGAYPHQLSGGQRQRVVIAQAVASRPALVIADEATSKLDAALQNDILALLNEMRIRYGTALLLISHDPGVLAGFADRIVVMYAGRIVEQASAVEIFTNPLHPYTNALLRLAASSRDTAEAGLRQLPAIDGEPPELSVASSGCRFEPRCADKFRLCLTDYPREVNVAGRQVSCFKYGE